MDKKIPTEKLSEREKKWLLRFSWVFVIFSLVTTLFFGLHSLYLKYNPEQPAITAERVLKDPAKVAKHVRVNGTDYSIPVSYFNFHVPHATEDFQIYLLAMYPELSAPTGQEAKDYMSGKTHAVVTILSDDPRFMKSIGQIAKGRLSSTHHNVLTGHQYGLDVYEVEAEKGSGRPVPYLARENDRVVTVISCGEDHIKGYHGKIFPQCTHHFSDGYLMYQLDYPKEYLANWKEMEDKTRMMFSSFRQSAKEKNLDKVVISP